MEGGNGDRRRAFNRSTVVLNGRETAPETKRETLLIKQTTINLQTIISSISQPTAEKHTSTRKHTN